MAWAGLDPLLGVATAQVPRADGPSSELHVAIAGHQWRDDVLAPVRHGGWGPVVEFRRDRPGLDILHRWQARLAPSPVRSRFERASESLVALAALSYARLAHATDLSDRAALWIGGQLRGASDVAHFGPWDDSHLYWLTTYSLDIAGAIEYHASEQAALWLEWTVPVAALASRPDATIQYKSQEWTAGAVVARLNQGLRPTSLHELRAFDVAVRYVRPAATWGRTMFWRIEYTNAALAGSAKLEILRHSVGATVGW